MNKSLKSDKGEKLTMNGWKSGKIMARVRGGGLMKDFCFVLFFDRDVNLLRRLSDMYKVNDRGTWDPEPCGRRKATSSTVTGMGGEMNTDAGT